MPRTNGNTSSDSCRSVHLVIDGYRTVQCVNADSDHIPPHRASGSVPHRMCSRGLNNEGFGSDQCNSVVVHRCRAASADDYGVHPACIAAPAPASPNHKRSSSSGHSHGMVSRALQAVKVRVWAWAEHYTCACRRSASLCRTGSTALTAQRRTQNS